MFIRRAVRFCENPDCKEQLRKRDGEAHAAFIVRVSCGGECAEVVRAMRKEKGVKGSKCFCGAPGNPYCCWDHRLIANKCRQWGIPLSLKEFHKHSDMLEKQQREIDQKYGR